MVEGSKILILLIGLNLPVWSNENTEDVFGASASLSFRMITYELIHDYPLVNIVLKSFDKFLIGVIPYTSAARNVRPASSCAALVPQSIATVSLEIVSVATSSLQRLMLQTMKQDLQSWQIVSETSSGLNGSHIKFSNINQRG
jgi:hypothetical protein